MKSPVEVVIDLMNETPEQTETRRALAKAQRESYEDEQLIRKLENNDIYANKERDMDLSEESKSDFCVDKPVRNSELL